MLIKNCFVKSPFIALCLFLILFLSSFSFAEHLGETPKHKKTAISLSYDDALNSQLDNVIPALNKYNFKASFYLSLNSEVVRERLDEWRAIAQQGHELGNHTINHACRASLPGREWVSADNDLDKRSASQIKQEVMTANVFLQAIDGETQRTFTIPCGDILANGVNYLPLVEDLFVAIKGVDIEEGISTLWAPSDVSGQELVDYVKNHSKDYQLINILFHGVGGDYLSVSQAAHNELLAYLYQQKEDYWVDSFINIMNHQKEL